MSTALLIQKTDTGVPLALTIARDGTGGLTGLSPTVAIRRGDSSTLYLDWATGTFLAVGWTSKYAAMTEIERGHYVRILNAATTAGILAGQSLVAEYRVDDGASIKGEAHDLLTVVEELYDIQTEGAGVGAPTAAEVADAVWDEVLAGHLTPGSTGAALDTASSGGAVPTVGQIADAVWDEAIAGHLAAGSTGEALNDADAGAGSPTVAQIADGVWDEATAAHTAAGSFGLMVNEIRVEEEEDDFRVEGD